MSSAMACKIPRSDTWRSIIPTTWASISMARSTVSTSVGLTEFAALFNQDENLIPGGIVGMTLREQLVHLTERPLHGLDLTLGLCPPELRHRRLCRTPDAARFTGVDALQKVDDPGIRQRHVTAQFEELGIMGGSLVGGKHARWEKF
jgi:hypothetical protein